ncbi:MAG: AsmA family protein [Alphaproteobacteria bacterium]|nr:AsmA family protein [Alphaproteobacteria bacterium]
MSEVDNRRFDWLRSLTQTQRLIVWIAVGFLLAILAVWLAFNIAMANAKFATPTLNWALHTFGNKSAHIQRGRLEHPFGSRLLMRTLDWPGRADAEELDVAFDLFGFLPGRPWTRYIRVRDGDLILDSKASGPKTIDPQKWVNHIDAQNVTLRYTRRGEPHEVKIISASGSFAKGTVKAEAFSGASHISFDGMARQGGGSLSGEVAAKGDNLRRLADLVGASAPDTPPFDIKGKLEMHARTWSVSDINGKMGDSDLGGKVAIDLTHDKPFLKVDLASKKLDFDDLGVVFGVPVGVGEGETANAEQRQARAAFNKSGRLIPDARIDFSRLKAVNADIRFAAAKVVDAPAGVASLTLSGTLRDQVLDFNQALVKTSTGDLDAKIHIDARSDPAHSTARGTLSHVQINRLISSNYVTGSLNGTFNLKFTGSGFREAAATATGEAGVWSPDSKIAKLADEAAGLDIGEILLLYAKREAHDYIPSTCAAGNIAFSKGVAQLAPAVIDNKDSTILATGGANLKSESLDVHVMAKPKDISLGKLNGEIHVRGTLRHPSVSALNGKTLLQGVFSSALSTVTGALAVLPFIETGGGKDAPCATLIADAKSASEARNPAKKVAESKASAKDKPKKQIEELSKKATEK